MRSTFAFLFITKRNHAKFVFVQLMAIGVNLATLAYVLRTMATVEWAIGL